MGINIWLHNMRQLTRFTAQLRQLTHFTAQLNIAHAVKLHSIGPIECRCARLYWPVTVMFARRMYIKESVWKCQHRWTDFLSKFPHWFMYYVIKYEGENSTSWKTLTIKNKVKFIKLAVVNSLKWTEKCVKWCKFCDIVDTFLSMSLYQPHLLHTVIIVFNEHSQIYYYQSFTCQPENVPLNYTSKLFMLAIILILLHFFIWLRYFYWIFKLPLILCWCDHVQFVPTILCVKNN